MIESESESVIQIPPSPDSSDPKNPVVILVRHQKDTVNYSTRFLNLERFSDWQSAFYKYL